LNTAADSHRQVFRIDAAHPCLPGHFPGQPLVPAVLLLQQVAEALADWRDVPLKRVVEAKFLAPLLPDEDAQVELQAAGDRYRFEIHRGDALLARGRVEAGP
jgi:3-hydroxyacyl-[acyl-carrier-protein] dehydratase